MATLRTRGFTLIELVVVVGLVGMLSIGMISIFLASLRGSSYAQAEAELKSQGDYAITLMERNIRNAVGELICSAAYDEVTFSIKNGSDELVPVVYAFDSGNGDILIDGQPLFGNATNAVSVDNATFTCNPAVDGFSYGSVTIRMTLRANDKMSSEDLVQTFITTAAVRSKP